MTNHNLRLKIRDDMLRLERQAKWLNFLWKRIPVGGETSREELDKLKEEFRRG